MNGRVVRIAWTAIACGLGGCSASSPGSLQGAPGANATVGQPGAGSPGTGGSFGGNGTQGATGGASGAPLGSGVPMAGLGTGGGAAPPAAGGTAGVGMPAGGMQQMQPGAAGGSTPTTVMTPHGGTTCLQAGSGNYGEPGPYQVGMMDVDLGMVDSGQSTGMYTIFYPMPLEDSCPHPIIAWGNGTGVSDSTTYAFFNSNAASWGMVVAAAQDPNAGSGNFHKAGLDWLLKQNDDPSSMFYQKLSTRAGVAGHSQGGIGATAGSQHPNVEAEVSVAGGGVPKAGIAFICLTGTMDFVEGPCTQSYQAATGPAFLADWMNGDHVTTETLAGYIQRDPGSLAMQRLYSAWFRCFLADDGNACALFDGAPDSCGICMDSGWAKHESRNF